MISRREQILRNVVTALNAGSAPVYRSRVEPLSREESPAIVVEPVQDQASQTAIGRLYWQLGVRVSLIVRGDTPDQIADPIIQEIHTNIMADLTLGGAAYDVQPTDVRFEMIEGDMPIGVITMDYNVLYITNLHDLTHE